jgi:hypothetical protein
MNMDISATERLSQHIDNLDSDQAASCFPIDRAVEDTLSDLIKNATRPRKRQLLTAGAERSNPLPENQIEQNDRSTDNNTIEGTAHANTVGFRKIGFGQCGLILQRPGRDFVVKIARPHFQEALWSDFVAHFHVYQAFRGQWPSIVCRVPKVFSYINKDNAWWGLHHPLLPEHESYPMPSMALVTERILPLPRVAREALVAKYCPQDLQASVLADPSNRDCLARIYLGRRRPENAPLAPNFTLRNFNLCLDQMVDLYLPVGEYAAAIGEALAVMHWQANVDGYDVEFVLGCETDSAYRDGNIDRGLTSADIKGLRPHSDTDVMTLDTMMPANVDNRPILTRMWVLDFNLCSRWEERVGWEQPKALIEHLVLAFFDNDPYYPLPPVDVIQEKTLWEEFTDGYLEKSREILRADGKDKRLGKLPNMFIDSCVERERERLRAGLGRRHLDLKVSAAQAAAQ